LVKDLLYNFDYNSLKPDAPKISAPVKVSHDFSIHYNPETGEVKGVPQDILDAIKNAGYTVEQVTKNPELVKDLLYNFDYNSLKPDAPKISPPIQSSHDFRIGFDPLTGEVTGVPEPVLEAIKKAGHTLEEVIANPMLVKDLLYSLDYAQLKEASSPISKPVHVAHDFSISFDNATGQYKGIPQAVEEAILKAGFTVEQVTKDPSLVKDLLYNLDYGAVKESTQLQVSAPTNFHRDFSIKYDPKTGKVEGIPEEIKKSLLEKGYTEADVLANPSIIKEYLYTLNYDQVKGTETKKQH